MATAQTGTINSLLRGEIAATETYNQALEKFAGQAEESELRRLRDQHRAAANTLREHVHQNAGEPSTGPKGDAVPDRPDARVRPHPRAHPRENVSARPPGSLLPVRIS